VVRLRWPQTPCAVRLREPNSPPMTSDATCRSVAPAPRISCPGPDARVARLTPCIGGSPHRQGRLKTRRFRAWPRRTARSAFRRIGPRSHDRDGPRVRVFQDAHRGLRHPFARRRSPAAVRRSRAPVACYPAFSGPFRPPRAFDPRWPLYPATDRERCSSSTSATDSQGTCTMSNRSTLGVARPLARPRHARRRKIPGEQPES